MNACTLCETCRGILVDFEGLRHQGDDGKYFWHHESVEDLHAAVDLGCQFCGAFWGKLSKTEQATLTLIDPLDGRLMSAMVWRGDRFGLPPFDPGTLAVQIGVDSSLEQTCGLSFRYSEQDFLLKPLTEVRKSWVEANIEHTRAPLLTLSKWSSLPRLHDLAQLLPALLRLTRP